MTKDDWLKQIKERPDDRALRLAFADWLEEAGDRIEAFKQREKAGVGEVLYYVGFLDHPDSRVGPWRQLGHLKRHIRQRSSDYGRAGKYPLFLVTPPAYVSHDRMYVKVYFQYKATQVGEIPLEMK